MTWRDVVGYEGMYLVNNEGVIKNYRGKILRGGMTGEKSNSYKKVTLTKNGKLKDLCVHRIVAEAFIPNPDNLPIVNHKDGNKLNNTVENLEWCTQQYNIQSYHDSKRLKRVYCVELDMYFDGITRAQNYLRSIGYPKASRTLISANCLGRVPQAYKLHWEYR